MRRSLWVLAVSIGLIFSGFTAYAANPDKASADRQLKSKHSKQKQSVRSKRKQAKLRIKRRQSKRVTKLSTRTRQGIDLSITIPDVEPVESLAYQRMKTAGAKFMRIIIFWNTVAPSVKPIFWNPANHADPHYRWEYIDAQVREAKKAGLTPLLQIHSAPSWAERCAVVGEPNICNPDPALFTQFTIAAVNRYNGVSQPKVSYWQPWNEPNLHIFFKPQKVNNFPVSALLYRELLTRFAFVVKGLDANNKVVAGGLAPLGGKNSVGPLAFAKQLLCMQGQTKFTPEAHCSAPVPFDIWAMNPYTTGGPTRSARSPDDVQLGDMKHLVNLINSAKRHGRINSTENKIPVWITEFSWDSKPADPKGLSPALHARWISEAIYRSWQAGVSNFFWFSLRDWRLTPGETTSDNLESGLWIRGSSLEKDKAKPALRAFQFSFVAFRSGKRITLWGRTKDGKPGKISIWQRKSKRWQKVAVIKSNREGVFSGRIRLAVPRGTLQARNQGIKSIPFALKPVKDFYFYPFG